MKKIFLSLVIAMLTVGISEISYAMSCHGKDSQPQEVAQAESANQQIEAPNVGNKICPVSAEKIDEKIKATYEYKGKIYNFCCAMCIEEFKKDPGKYIKKIENELQAESKESGHEGHEMDMMQSSETMPREMHQGHQH